MITCMKIELTDDFACINTQCPPRMHGFNSGKVLLLLLFNLDVSYSYKAGEDT